MISIVYCTYVEGWGDIPKPRPKPPTALIHVGVSVFAIDCPDFQVMYSVVKGPMALDTSLAPCAMDMIWTMLDSVVHSE